MPELTHDELHGFAPAYALDALDEHERRAFESHLAGCERCRSEVASARDAASALAYAPTGAAPAAALRARILEAAREEGPANVVPLRSRRRWLAPAASIGAVAAAAAIAFGVWQAVDSGSDASRLAWSLQVQPNGSAQLAVEGLRRAPDGKIYEVWVIDRKPVPAGTFVGGRRVTVRLTRPVRRGSVVAVTLERYPGVGAPTGEILLKATA